MDAPGFLESVRRSAGYRRQIAHVERIPARSAVFGDVDPPITGRLAQSLSAQGLDRLYCHQAEALDAVRRGESIVVVTSTASGKTLCYNIPVLEALEADPQARALYIYPTKALAQDQFAKLQQYGLPGLKAATYDGDTPRRERPFVKTSANVVLTNPDMLHVGILPYHTTWSSFLRNLRYVVVDEVHSYRGVFGAHVANVIRRLRRIASHYGASPQFVCASATVREPGKLVGDLIGVDARVIDRDGSPSGEKMFAFWNPPFLPGRDGRRSPNSEAVDLFVRLVESGVRTIVFTKARKTAELILRYARAQLRERGSPAQDLIMAYRAGYRPAERRQIERRLFNGELIGITSTTALEVGVDIGGLDAALMVGYPGTVASTWQQAGRAGRAAEQSLAVLIALDDPVDQFLMRNPDYFFRARNEVAVVNPCNPYILADHVLCAAYELPIDNEEIEPLFGARAWEVLGVLEEVGQVCYDRQWRWCGSEYPARNVNIRSASGAGFDIVSVDGGGALLGTADASSAFQVVHPGAIYLHGGESYVVTRLDIASQVAYVERTEVNYYTLPGSVTQARVAEEVEATSLRAARVCFGDVCVKDRVTHFWRKQLFTERNLQKVALDLPEVTLDTEAVWISVPKELTDRLVGRGFDLTGTIHAAEHASIALMPLFAMCDRQDVGGVSHPSHPDTGSLAAIFIYDGYPGGVGLARAAFGRIDELLAAALAAIDDCKCDAGCPSCVQSPKCGSNNDPLDKAGAAFLLRELLNA